MGYQDVLGSDNLDRILSAFVDVEVMQSRQVAADDFFCWTDAFSLAVHHPN